MKRRTFICSFSSGLDDMKRSDQKDMRAVLRVLDKWKRYSCFDASANDAIAKTVTDIYRLGFVKDVGGAYPWSEVELTDAGRVFMEASA